jgi:hypothetical protein
MRIVLAGVLTSAVLSSNAYAGGSAWIDTQAHAIVNVYSSQIDGYGSIDGSLVSTGAGAYALTPGGEGSGGVGATGGGEDITLGWAGSVAAPPQSSAQGQEAWFPYDDANSDPIPLVHVSNDTEFDSQLQVQLYYDFQTSGATSGDGGAQAINLVSFSVFCTACTGLPMNYYNGAENVEAGNYYGGSAGGFADEVTNTWNLHLDLMPDSSLTVLETVSSSVSLDARSAVPEPAVWMMMMSGFGGLGARLRSLRRKAITTTWVTPIRSGRTVGDQRIGQT